MGKQRGSPKLVVYGGGRNAFIRAHEAFALIKAAAGDPEKLAKIQYKSRGKGRGTPARNYGNPGSNWKPNGAQECLRREMGGWAACRRNTGMTKHQFLYRTLANV